MDYYKDSFRYFEFRKILRMAGDEAFDRAHPIHTTVIVLLWFIDFLVYNTQFTRDSLTFVFYDWTSQPEDSKYISELWIGLIVAIISFVMMMTAVIWQKRSLVLYNSLFLFLALILSIIARNASSGWIMRWIILTSRVVVTAVISAIVLHQVWRCLFVPQMIRYHYSKSYSNQSCIQSDYNFPYPEMILMLFYSVVVFPLWIPFLLFLTLLLIFNAVGLPVDTYFSLSDACKLSMYYWIFSPISYKMHYSPDPAFYLRLITCNWVRDNSLPAGLFARSCYHFEYCGERDQSSKPHGYGEWRDSDPYGEVYRGYWIHGLPVGPGRSQVGVGGSVFAQVRIGYCCCVDGHVDASAMRPRWRYTSINSDGVDTHTTSSSGSAQTTPGTRHCQEGSHTGDCQGGSPLDEVVGVNCSRAAESGTPFTDQAHPGRHLNPVFGAAAVACCISKTFYRGHPYVSYFTDTPAFSEVFAAIHPNKLPLFLPPRLPVLAQDSSILTWSGSIQKDSGKPVPRMSAGEERPSRRSRLDVTAQLEEAHYHHQADDTPGRTGAHGRRRAGTGGFLDFIFNPQPEQQEDRKESDMYTAAGCAEEGGHVPYAEGIVGDEYDRDVGWEDDYLNDDEVKFHHHHDQQQNHLYTRDSGGPILHSRPKSVPSTARTTGTGNGQRGRNRWAYHESTSGRRKSYPPSGWYRGAGGGTGGGSTEKEGVGGPIEHMEAYPMYRYKEGFGLSASTSVSEALIFIPGFNTSLNTCIGIFSQFCTLAGLPEHLTPWIFHWPCGGLPFYYASTRAAVSEMFQVQLDALVTNLYNQGIIRIHFICHSLGARGFLAFIEKTTSLRPRALPSHSPHTPRYSILPGAVSPTHRGPQLGHVILVQPEGDLSDFEESSLPCIKQYTASTTLYVDPKDVSMVRVERANEAQAVYHTFREYVKGMWGALLGGNCSDNRGLSGPEGVVSSPPLSLPPHRSTRTAHRHEVPHEQARTPAAATPSTTVETNTGTRELGRILQYITAPSSLLSSSAGRRSSSIFEADIDIIDTTNIRRSEEEGMVLCSHFRLNKEVIDDIREIIVYRKKAEQRSGRLIRRESTSNVFDFLVAPSFVQN